MSIQMHWRGDDGDVIVCLSRDDTMRKAYRCCNTMARKFCQIYDGRKEIVCHNIDALGAFSVRESTRGEFFIRFVMISMGIRVLMGGE